jgi:hypothetical protein
VAAKNDPEVVAKAVPIHEQTLAVIAPDHPEWDDIAVHKEFQKALERIQQAKIDHYPHDHFSVPELFSDKFYSALMRELPPPSQYKQVAYPGTDPLYQAILLSDEVANRGPRVTYIFQNHARERKMAAGIKASNFTTRSRPRAWR